MQSRQVCRQVLSKNDMMWMTEREGVREGGIWKRQTSLAAVSEHQRLHLSCSREEVPPCLYASLLLIQEKYSIFGLSICPLRGGLRRKIWPSPSVLSSLWTVFRNRLHSVCNLQHKRCHEIEWADMMTRWNGRGINGLTINMLLKLSLEKILWYGFAPPPNHPSPMSAAAAGIWQ